MTAARTSSAPGRRPPSQESLVGRIAAMSVLVVLTIYFLIPAYFLLVSSTKSQGDFASTFGLWFADLNFADNLRTLFTTQDGLFGRWAVNSLIYAGGGALIGTFLSALAGYALAKFRFRGRDFLFSVILSGVLVPSATLALPLFLMFSAVHQVNTYWSVILPSVVNPFGVFLARVFTSASVPEAILESARIDGASEFRIFRQVSLRLLAPGLVTIFLFQFIGIWNNFFLPMVMLQSEELYPITLGLFNWNAAVSQQPDLQQSVITGSFVSIVPLIVLFLMLQRFWRTGLAAGAVR
ncbi:carbohydrate ABC transporter permease [Cryptosporangium sp. NPDC048952]|uniref:carbohydrate ABC transporter permease n=1 Tax=Cryptosporangium sp. NPDC048952 TaxID=3363961 RepID=UPI00371E1BD4